MPTIRELVAAIRQRDGVEAAIVLGRDGLLIDGQTVANLDAEGLAAHVPSMVTAADEFGSASGRGSLTTGVFECPAGLVVVSVLSADAVLLVLVQPRANVGQLLFELRRNREHMAALMQSDREAGRLQEHHVLVADDEPHIGRIIKMKLEQGPFRVTLVYDGQEALDALERESDIDIVLLDLMMPRVSGLDVLSQLRASSRYRDLPCVILTAAGQEAQHRRAMALGATDFLTKPFSPKKLYARTAELVGIVVDESGSADA